MEYDNLIKDAQKNQEVGAKVIAAGDIKIAKTIKELSSVENKRSGELRSIARKAIESRFPDLQIIDPSITQGILDNSSKFLSLPLTTQRELVSGLPEAIEEARQMGKIFNVGKMILDLYETNKNK